MCSGRIGNNRLPRVRERSPLLTLVLGRQVLAWEVLRRGLLDMRFLRGGRDVARELGQVHLNPLQVLGGYIGREVHCPPGLLDYDAVVGRSLGIDLQYDRFWCPDPPRVDRVA